MKLVFAGALLLVGCAHTLVTPEALAGKNVAVIQSDRLVRVIAALDGRRLMNGSAQETLAPGEHDIKLLLAQETAWLLFLPVGVVESGYAEFKLNAEAGHVYQVQDLPARFGSRTSVGFRLVDEASGRDVGDLVSSWHESLSTSTPVFAQSPFFQWSPPQNESWTVESRDSRGVKLAKDGAEDGESAVVAIRVFKLPPLQGANEFADYVRQQWDKLGANSRRFEVLQEKFEPFSGREDLCVRYHQSVLDKSPRTAAALPADPIISIGRALGGALSNPHSMILESFGYVCRKATNPAAGINFEFSRRTYEEQKNDDMAARTDRSFAQLKF
jgi:hypothetical protein